MRAALIPAAFLIAASLMVYLGHWRPLVRDRDRQDEHERYMRTLRVRPRHDPYEGLRYQGDGGGTWGSASASTIGLTDREVDGIVDAIVRNMAYSEAVGL